MKAFRIWLLLVLAVLLPVRGAVAAAMLCPVAGNGLQGELPIHSPSHHAMDRAMDHSTQRMHQMHQMHQVHHADQADPANHSIAHAHDGAHHEHGTTAAPSHGPGEAPAAADECDLCSAYCSITPLVSEVPRLPAPLDPPAARFPHVPSPAPLFLCGGPERPPRST